MAKRGFQKWFYELFTGRFLITSNMLQRTPFILMLVIVMFMYIANHYQINTMLVEKEKLQKDIEELSALYSVYSDQMADYKRLSFVKERVEEKNTGLRKSTQPPLVIR